MKRRMSPGRRFTSMAAWLCFEPFAGSFQRGERPFRSPIEACSQDLGSMITEPATDGQTRPLQDFETLYIGGAEPAVVLRSPSGGMGPNQDYVRLLGKFNDHDGSYRLGG